MTWQPPQVTVYIDMQKTWYGWKAIVTDNGVIRRSKTVLRTLTFESMQTKVRSEFVRRTA